MTRTLVAAASALFLGAVITEIHTRLFAGQPVAMLLLSVAAIFVGSIVTLRAATRSDSFRIWAPARANTAAPIETESDQNDDRETGRVKWFNRTKGFGFIVRDSGGEVFVHHRNIRGTGRRSLKDGEYVRFKVTTHDKGPQAEQVSVTREP
jgi:CspA family cold shock protein